MTHTDKKQTKRSERLAFERIIRGTKFRVVLVSGILLFGVLYIGQTSSVSTKGFVISDLQRQIQQVERENQSLHVQIATHTSMNTIQQRLADKGYIDAGQPTYITPVGTAVVRR